jgi:exopolysaccharide production protein ExoZ
MVYPWVIDWLQSDALFVVVMMVMSTLVGLASYYLFEVPVGRYLASDKRWRVGQSRPSNA